MADRKPFLLRLPPELLDELRRWAADEMRSLNAQIEYALRQALRQRGRPPRDERRAARDRRRDGDGGGTGGS